MTLLQLRRDGSGPPVVWLHGFTQTAQSAKTLRSILTGEVELLTCDLPGHGTSSHVRANLSETATLIVDSVPDDVFFVAGYSLGGRVALHVALQYPHRLAGLITLSATRGIYDPGERHARAHRDYALAEHALNVGSDAFLAEWISQPMFASLGALAESDTRSRDVEGLASSLRLAGTGQQDWLGDDLVNVKAPVLAMAGARDEKFLLEAREIAERTKGEFQLISEAGHAAHLEHPHKVARLVGDFVLRNWPPPPRS